MRSSLAIFLVAAIAVSLAAQAKADIIPPIGLAPGSEYQLIFVTEDTTVGSFGIEAPYNAFVNVEAALNPLLPSATWSAVTSTADGTNANANAQNIEVGGSYLPVYNTQGLLVSDNSSGGLYAGSLVGQVAYDQYGVAYQHNTWTGSTNYGLAASPLGAAEATYGEAYPSFLPWLDYAVDLSTSTYALYALSSAITVPTPEPATITLLGSALSLLAGYRLLRRRAMAKQIV